MSISAFSISTDNVVLSTFSKDILNVFLVNVLTNPILVASTTLIKVLISIKAYHIAMPIFEISAFLIEGFIYHKCLTHRKINGFLLSLILNICCCLSFNRSQS